MKENRGSKWTLLLLYDTKHTTHDISRKKREGKNRAHIIKFEIALLLLLLLL